jgi:hypothetical protein
MLRTLGVCIVFVLVAGLAAAAGLTAVEPGVYRVGFDDVDELLGLSQRSDVYVLIVEDKEPKRVSEAHVARVRDWVVRGGVLWAADDGLESLFVVKLASPIVRRFDYKKAGTGKRGGELVVRGESLRMVIHDLPLTTDIEQLYLFPHRRFNGTEGAQPLVEMTDEEGNHGLVLAAVPLGRGLVVLDGTARSRRRLPFGRLPGFDPDHPNALKQDGVWRNYDWPKLLANAKRRAAEALR